MPKNNLMKEANETMKAHRKRMVEAARIEAEAKRRERRANWSLPVRIVAGILEFLLYAAVICFFALLVILPFAAIAWVILKVIGIA